MADDDERDELRDYTVSTIIEKVVEAVVGIAWRRVNVWLDEQDAHRSGEARREFNQRFAAALAKQDSVAPAKPVT